MSRLLGFGIALMVMTLPACERAADPPAVAVESTAPDAPSEPEIFRPDAERENLAGRRIYYTLTDFEWYARGEPLLHEGRPYEPSGVPVAASSAEMTLAGDYEGVDYYTRRDDAQPSLYVPVFEGYWLPFRADTTARPAAAETMQ